MSHDVITVVRSDPMNIDLDVVSKPAAASPNAHQGDGTTTTTSAGLQGKGGSDGKGKGGSGGGKAGQRKGPWVDEEVGRGRLKVVWAGFQAPSPVWDRDFCMALYERRVVDVETGAKGKTPFPAYWQ